MAITDKPLAYLRNLRQAGEGDSTGLMRVGVEVEGFPDSSQGLGPGTYTIGASPDCDLIIPEAPADEIAELIVRNPSEGAHELVSLARGATLNNENFAPQKRVELTRISVLKIGPARITFAPKLSTFQRATQAVQAVKVPVSLTLPLALIIIAGVLGATAWYSSGSKRPGPNEIVYNAPTRAPDKTLQGAVLTTPEDVVKELNRMFAAADLSDRITATAEGKDVVVHGAVDPRAEPRMTEVLKMVSARSRVDIHSKVRPDPSSLMGVIAGVSLSPSRYIVLRDGDRYHIGDLMPNGWTVEAIDEKHVTVARDDMHESVDFTQ